jgi:hypothetical protein
LAGVLASETGTKADFKILKEKSNGYRYVKISINNFWRFFIKEVFFNF